MTSVALQRGLIVTVATAGVYSGKPRPAVVVQANRWLQGHPSVTLCPLTSTLVDAPLMDISSSFIRKAIGQGKDVRHLMPSAAYRYMREMHFYEQ